MTSGDATELLQRWHGGDARALHDLVAAHRGWLVTRIKRRLGPALQRREDVSDLVQEAALEALAKSPRFVPADLEQLRALLARLVENLLRDRLKLHHAHKRDLRKERPIPSDSVLLLDPTRRTVTRASEAASANEMQAWIQLALELLRPADRQIVLWRQWEERSFREIGAELGVPENTARMRFDAALQRLGARLRELMRGNVRADDEGIEP
jgi:RNA polymerase sigma factor (sigma-70 family)